MAGVTVKMSEGGRIVIPAEYRKELGIEVGDDLLLHMEKGRIVLLTRKQAIQYVQEQVARYNIEGRKLSEEIIAERRLEASRQQLHG